MLNACKKILLLTCAGVLLWGFFGVLSPRLVALFPSWKHYGDVQDFHGIQSGLMYYTDLATWQETQNEVRYAIKKSEQDKLKD